MIVAEDRSVAPRFWPGKEKVFFTTFNYCVGSIFNLNVQNQESFNLQLSKQFDFHPSPVSKAVLGFFLTPTLIARKK